ncbi:UDP-4-keto-6-deoxy-N-acetylglucosamine4-aminotra nsferase [Thalassoporum mexicanum PCC 7367]|uniref:UDP-4-amino-4, 6-dideoxy-N-acetyl-beta-L-altrosamine transaminase n=1 Tax=Thalassoporum mexicanum TaxID=3457544 RepID=UPI00029FA780|nr:UDP-4-amino-4,6-dideoxy-N-acetyl-beta-L-altrosamine transaminase [Pseudanabaena sp. PCC 7367]AFY68392.1 UDP-4-keto-6-deoxy-N-acetylglucosamine4-aminotra nsferase [Pseudanabaena sp. PCC 7367]
MSDSEWIPYGKQDINQQDIDSVIEVLRSPWITQGPAIERFEAKVANHCGAKYAVAVSSATAALHIACLAAGLQPGDWLWTSPNTFVASANCGLYCGAQVDFVDINPRTYNLSIAELERKLAQAERTSRSPKVLIPVHMAGQSCEMEQIAALSRKYGFKVIEDASHGIGAQYQNKHQNKYQNQPVGDCRFSDMTVFSFHPVKIITTGEGGMVVTNNPDLYEKLIRLRTHGITRNQNLMVGDPHGTWYYQQLELGYNYRITDIQAALGASQMDRLTEFVQRRRDLAKRYDRLLKDLPIALPWQHPDTLSSWHLYIIRLQLKQISLSHSQVFDALRSAQIGVNLHYIPVHIQPYYQNLGFKWGDFPAAEQYYREAISIPLFSGMSEAQQDRVISTLTRILSK